jgi:hypothetical protein
MTARVPPFIREVCPVCLLGAEGCLRCSGTGYVLKNPWDPRTSGEQREEPQDVPASESADTCRRADFPPPVRHVRHLSPWWKRLWCWLDGHDYDLARWGNGHSALLCRRCGGRRYLS